MTDPIPPAVRELLIAIREALDVPLPVATREFAAEWTARLQILDTRTSAVHSAVSVFADSRSSMASVPVAIDVIRNAHAISPITYRPFVSDRRYRVGQLDEQRHQLADPAAPAPGAYIAAVTS